MDLAGLTWRPARRSTPVLADLELTIEAGERVLVAGPNGAGKSTLLRALAGLLLTAGHGELTGHAFVGGRPAGERPGAVALLQQDPAASVVAETVGRDVAFGPENVQSPRADIWRVVHRVLAETEFPYDVEHPTRALSGGESQRLALAGGLALRSDVLLLDEPTAMLDDETADAVRRALRTAVQQQGSTLVVVEHRIGPWLDFVDRLLVLGHDGSLVADGPPDRVLDTHGTRLAASGVWVPGVPPPRVVALDAALVAPCEPASGEAVAARQVGVTLKPGTPGLRRPTVRALDAVDARVSAGRLLAVRGRSGAGKSTLVHVLAGLVRPTTGSVVSSEALATRKGREPWRWSSRDLAARIAWSPQLPEVGMTTSTVRAELTASGRSIGREPGWLDRRVTGLMEAFGLEPLADVSPYHLSGGEQRRLMVAAALAHGPAAALFDEPTVGQDRTTWAAVMAALGGARDAGSAVAVATHDTLTIEQLSDETLTLTQPDHGTVR